MNKMKNRRVWRCEVCGAELGMMTEASFDAGGRACAEHFNDDGDDASPELESMQGLSVCSECGAHAESVIMCPDGAEVCQACFDAGRH